MKSTDFATLLSGYFTRYLPNERGSSPQTIDSYRNAFILYLEYMESIWGIKPENLSVKDYTRESILGFLKWLEEERGNSCISSSVFPKNRKEKFPILGIGYSHISAGNIFI